LLFVAQVALAVNSSLPTFANPLDNLAVSIPGLDSQAAKISGPTGSSVINSNWIAVYIIALYRYGLAIIGIIAVVSIAIGGLLWVMSAGNSGSISRAQGYIKDALLGVGLLLGSFLILSTINRDLIIFKSLNLSYTEPEYLILTSAGGSTINLNQYKGGSSFITSDDTYDNLLKQYSDQFNVDCTLVKAHMMAESGGNPNAVSSAGAVGLMQLMPATANALGITDLTNPAQSIMGGAKYIAQLATKACNGSSSNEVCNTSNIRYRIAAYNGGPGANKPSKTCPGLTYWECTANHNYSETRNYVNTVEANYQRLKQLDQGC